MVLALSMSKLEKIPPCTVYLQATINQMILIDDPDSSLKKTHASTERRRKLHRGKASARNQPGIFLLWGKAPCCPRNKLSRSKIRTNLYPAHPQLSNNVTSGYMMLKKIHSGGKPTSHQEDSQISLESQISTMVVRKNLLVFSVSFISKAPLNNRKSLCCTSRKSLFILNLVSL